jgi:general secretion pathway protein I
MPLKRRQRGYSLIEVLVAFAILAMALTVLLRIFSGGLRNVDAASEYAQAVLVAEAELAVPGILEALQPGLTDGVAEGGFEWRRQVQPYDPNSDGAIGPILPYYIAVEVSWPSQRGKRYVQLETIRLGEAGTFAGTIE